jgi:hypothetical protein
MVQKWITKRDGNESRRIRIETDRKAMDVLVRDISPTLGPLEKQAWGLLGGVSDVSLQC